MVILAGPRLSATAVVGESVPPESPPGGDRPDQVLYVVNSPSPAPAECRRPRRYANPSGEVVTRPCGRFGCSRECRDLWAWKRYLILRQVFETEGFTPTHWLVLRLKKGGKGDLFAKVPRSMERMKRRCAGDLEYLMVKEWDENGVPHVHLALRMAGSIRPRPANGRRYKTPA